MPITRRINLQTQYGLDYTQTATKVKDKYAPGADQTALPNAWRYAQSIGMTSDNFRELRLFTAFHWDATWTWEAPTNVGKFLNTFNYIIVPEGSYVSNATAIVPRAGMEGASSFVYAGQGGDQGMVATEIKMDDVWLQGSTTSTERRLFDTPNSSGAGGNFAYNESMSISNIRLIGPNKKGDGITRIGLFLSWMGECTYMNQVRSDYFQHGFVARGGVPLTVGTISAFWNEIGGFSMFGSALATFNIQTLSGDGNKRLFNAVPGYGGEGGGRGHIGLIKYEDGTTGGAPLGNGCAMYLEGQYCISVGCISYANQAGALPQGMVIVKPVLTDGSPQNSFVNVLAAIGQGYSVALKNLVTGSEWLTPSYGGFSINHAGGTDVAGTAGTVYKGGSTGGGTTPPVEPPTTGAYPRTGWKCTAYATASEPNADPKNAIDSMMGWHWTNGEPQKNTRNQWFQVEVPSPIKIGKLTLATRNDRTTDYPLGLFAQTSNDGVNWTTTPVTISGTSNMTVTVTAAPTAKFIRLAPSVASQHWWSIEQLNIFPS